MAADRDALAADLHTKAAYAHTAAAFSHSTGDHASAQELARKALGDSVEAVRHSDQIVQEKPQALKA
jgi:hypothetical protein